jgi:hypothetical protein
MNTDFSLVATTGKFTNWKTRGHIISAVHTPFMISPEDELTREDLPG